jgi:hypothetical protein
MTDSALPNLMKARPVLAFYLQTETDEQILELTGRVPRLVVAPATNYVQKKLVLVSF